ncbi:transferase family-domain-containing protein [Exophiala viscosa]|uniref:Transferase family-domain-containing protein n=1 Tax=Exophiala viscosa TaxID=2486360 RepID=A0AAN6DZ81_9EURO|nr:transferase family-domain-containing protein [Exophiala viscosa]
MDSGAGNESGKLLDIELDVLAQQPRLNRLYTQVTLCFGLPNDSPLLESKIINNLKRGIDRLTASFPWVAGIVVSDNGAFKIRQSQDSLALVVKDLRNDPDFPTWDILSRSSFPFSMLNEDIIAPHRTLADSDTSTSGLPVFLIQANFIKGGLLLTFNAQHGSMDMAGQSQIMHLFAKACRDEPFTPSEIAIGNLDRKTIIDILDDDSDDELPKHTKKTVSQGQSKQPGSPEHLVWAYFIFSANSLAALKALATEAVPADNFVSTDDVLSAFTWQSICRARMAHLADQQSRASTLSRNVDMRRCLSIPPTYPGFVTHSTVHTSPVDVLVQESVGSVALRLRSALNGPTLSHQTRLQATRIKGGKDMAAFATSSVPKLDVRLSSWAKEKCYDLDFGFGKPSAVRRPRFTQGAREGLVYFLPKALGGEIAVGVCLRGEDMERLRTEEEFGRLGTYIG